MATKKSILRELGDLQNTTQFRNKDFKLVNNHFVNIFEHGKMLQSYGINVAVMFDDGTIFLDPKHDYSATTNKYVGQFVYLSKKERNEMIESGFIEIVELN